MSAPRNGPTEAERDRVGQDHLARPRLTYGQRWAAACGRRPLCWSWSVGISAGAGSCPRTFFLPGTGVWLSAVDLRHRLLPNNIVLPTLASGVVLLAAAAGAGNDWSALGRAVAGSAALFVLYLVLALISPAGMGMGDVKLAAVVGLFLAYQGWRAAGRGHLRRFPAGRPGQPCRAGRPARWAKEHHPVRTADDCRARSRRSCWRDSPPVSGLLLARRRQAGRAAEPYCPQDPAERGRAGPSPPGQPRAGQREECQAPARLAGRALPVREAPAAAAPRASRTTAGCWPRCLRSRRRVPRREPTSAGNFPSRPQAAPVYRRSSPTTGLPADVPGWGPALPCDRSERCRSAVAPSGRSRR